MSTETFMEKFWNFKGELDYVDDWPLMKSPYHVILIWIGYLIFVLKVGPAYMKNRPAYRCTTFLKYYNLVQVIFSFYQLIEGLNLLRPEGYLGISCNEDDATKRKIAVFAYLYLLAKISELSDTVLFVLRKKMNQVTFLHIYHHSAMLLLVWLNLKYEPVHSGAFLATINSFVHVIMYAYYGLSAYPSLTKYLWWKKYITAMQVLQFVFVIMHAVGNYYLNPICKPSLSLFVTILFNEVFFIYLFGKFYIKSYIKKKTDSVKAN